MSRLQLRASHVPTPALKMRVNGFTLIEVLTVIMIIGILTAIALPNYREYVRRSTLVEAITTLSDLRVRMEQSYLDNRSYLPGCGTVTATGKYFTYNVTNCSATTYQWHANGVVGAASGNSYTINESNVQTTTAWSDPDGPAGITVPKNCWLRTGAEC